MNQREFVSFVFIFKCVLSDQCALLRSFKEASFYAF